MRTYRRELGISTLLKWLLVCYGTEEAVLRTKDALGRRVKIAEDIPTWR